MSRAALRTFRQRQRDHAGRNQRGLKGSARRHCGCDRCTSFIKRRVFPWWVAYEEIKDGPPTP